MKKKGLILCLVLILTMITSAVYAEGEIIVRIDSTNVEFNDEIGRPFIDENNRTLVPFRAAMEAYGAEVEWDDATKTAKAIKEEITIEIPVGENHIVKNEEIIESDTSAIIKDGRTYLPIRNVIEAFGSEVQWDGNLKTVVITTEPIDGKAKIMDAYEKSYAWKNYDMCMLINMDMTIPDETGSMQKMDIQMDMDATALMNPMKMKVKANVILNVGQQELLQPVMEMYMVEDGSKFITYINSADPATGQFKWVKQELEDEGFADLLDPDNAEIKALNEQSIKEVKYFGTYIEDEINLEKYEVVISFDGFDEIMKKSFSSVSDSISDEEMQMSLDLFSNLDDMKYILYIDQATGEFVKMEMDLSSILNSIMEQMGDLIPAQVPEGLSEEEVSNGLIELIKGMNIKMDMVAKYLNINKAEDFEIPEEALNAISMEEYQEEIKLNVEVLEEVEDAEEVTDAEEVKDTEKVEEADKEETANEVNDQ